ncbi:hypothetical protein T06_13570 [Trichinella sp. T6]|nr:hypothetical protein T06_13570 [Trichinella sp. T6]
MDYVNTIEERVLCYHRDSSLGSSYLMKGVDRRQFQTFCRSVFNPLWFKGSMDGSMSGWSLHSFCISIIKWTSFDGLWFFYGLVLNPE